MLNNGKIYIKLGLPPNCSVVCRALKISTDFYTRNSDPIFNITNTVEVTDFPIIFEVYHRKYNVAKEQSLYEIEKIG
jgi:hypothetical protein